MTRRHINKLSIENARLMFKNFSGREQKYNREGDRNFCVVIEDHDQAQSLAEDGWKVRILPSRDEGDPPTHYIQVAVSFKEVPGIPPMKVYMMTDHSKIRLDETTIGELDYAEIQNVDLILRPYQWEVNGDTGVKAYLDTMYVTVYTDEFEAKYANVGRSMEGIVDV